MTWLSVEGHVKLSDEYASQARTGKEEIRGEIHDLTHSQEVAAILAVQEALLALVAVLHTSGAGMGLADVVAQAGRIQA